MTESDVNTADFPTQRPVEIALELILADQPELFCDTVGLPRIRLPPFRDRPIEEPWSLRSDRVRAWIAEFVWERAKLVLMDREIDRILNVLAGKAWRDQRQVVELYEAIEQDPVLEAVLVYLSSEPLFEGTMTKFQRELIKVAKRAGLDVKSKTWPKGAPQLSRRIQSLERLLGKAQITVERNRDSYERKIILKRQTDDRTKSPPSPPLSVDKSHHPKPQCRNDATDAQKRDELLAQLSQRSERKDP